MRKNLFDIIKGFVVTEKFYTLSNDGGKKKVALFTPLWVTKGMLKSTLSFSFKGLEIGKLNSMILRGKTKQFRGIKGKRKDRKRFVVEILAGDLDIVSEMS